MAHFWGFRPLWDIIHLTGHAMGWVGATFMALSLLYIPRKKKWFKIGTVRFWYRFHVFSGLLGFLLIFLHAYGKYYGIGGLNLLTLWLVWATGIIGYFLRRKLPEELLERVDEREEALNLLKDTEANMRRNLDRITSLKNEIEENGSVQTLLDNPRIKLPRPTLAEHPEKLFKLWREYREAGRWIKKQKSKVREQVAIERMCSHLREEDIATLIAVEHATRNLIFINEIYSLWRKLHVPLSWLMWWLLALHVFAWIYY
jgi:hypothetical protein